MNGMTRKEIYEELRDESWLYNTMYDFLTFVAEREGTEIAEEARSAAQLLDAAYGLRDDENAQNIIFDIVIEIHDRLNNMFEIVKKEETYTREIFTLQEK